MQDFTRQWNETDPADTDSAGYGAQEIREFKVDIRERLSLEHKFASSDLITDPTGMHLWKLITKTANYVTTLFDHILLVDASAGAVTITLVTAVGNGGKPYIIKKTDSSSNAVIVDPNGTETIDGQASISLTTQYATLAIISDGTNWVEISPRQAIYAITAGNAETATNADKVDTFHASQTPGANIIPVGDTNGRIAWGAKPGGRGCFVKRTAAQSIPNITWTYIDWDAEEYDTDNIHDNITNPSRLTVPTGITKVKLNFHTNWAANATGNREARIHKNGTGFMGMVDLIVPGSVAAVCAGTGILVVTAGDYFQLQVYQSSGAALNFASDLNLAWFTMEIIE